MAASYPSAVKNFSAVVNGVTKLVASLFNAGYDEITAIETELGTDPAGSLTDVKTRLAVSLNNNGTLKNVYDSGWFAVANGQSYVKTHNLNTTNLLVLAYGSDAADGSTNLTLQDYIPGEYETGICITAITTTQLTVQAGQDYSFHYFTTNGTQITAASAYCRIIALALS